MRNLRVRLPVERLVWLLRRRLLGGYLAGIKQPIVKELTPYIENVKAR